jgi:aspartate/methionine/tyrosine aminotransferase
VYTSSDFPSLPKESEFISMLSFDWRDEYGVDPGRIHVLYGMSKDFHSNGFRVATLISPFNPDLILSIRTTSPFMMTSTPADLLFSAILNDREFLAWFLAENKKRLREAYEFVVDWLKWHRVGYIPAYAGQFTLINLRPFLEDSPSNKDLLERLGIENTTEMVDREKALVMYGVRKYNVHLASGTAFHMSEGGWVRFTFSMERKKCVVGLRRVEKMMGWEEAPLPGASP